MKKFTVLSLIGFLILTFGATSYGQEKPPVLEFKASGGIWVLSEYNRNVSEPGMGGYMNATISGGTLFGPPATVLLPQATPTSGNGFDKTQAYMETRGRLKFDAIMGPNMMGTFYFEADSTRWGEVAPSYLNQRNYAGSMVTVSDRASVELKNMFLTFNLPGSPIPLTVQAGIQGLYIRSAFFLASDGPGVIATAKIDPATIRLLWFKALENEDFAADDIDFYGIEGSAKIETVNVGGYFVYVNAGSYPGQANTTVPTVGTGSDTYTLDPKTYAYSNVTYQAKMAYLGVYMDGKLGPVNANFDFIYNTGKITGKGAYANADAVKFNGFANKIKIDYPWEKFNFGVVSLYGSGSDMKKTGQKGYPGSTVANTSSGAVTSSKVSGYVLPPGTEGGTGESLILTQDVSGNWGFTGLAPSVGGNFTRAPFGGLWMGKVYGAYMAAPWYKVTLEAFYARDNTKNGNTIGTAVKPDGTPRDDNDIGWDLRLINEFQIYKNLKWTATGEILFAGAAMDYRVGTTTDNKGPKNPFAIATNLAYTF